MKLKKDGFVTPHYVSPVLRFTSHLRALNITLAYLDIHFLSDRAMVPVPHSGPLIIDYTLEEFIHK